MSAHLLTIDAKQRHATGAPASVADFSVTRDGIVRADVVCSNPAVSLYCFDDHAREAIFVELPPTVDLAAAPFVYQTQYEHAQRLIALPYATFLQVAATLPPVDRLIMIYMTGRSGSTLLVHLFNQLDTVLSLSEPDVGTQFVHLRRPDGSRDAELRALLDATVRMMFKPTASRPAATAVLKLRSEALQVMDLYQATFPQATNLFLYRDALGWVRSFYRLFTQWGAPETRARDEAVAGLSAAFNYDFTHLAALLDVDGTEISLVQELTVWWLAIMEWYLAQAARGIAILPVRYADLNAQREQVVTAIVQYCGLPTGQVSQALQVFAKDSQAGTALAREQADRGNTRQLSADQRQQIVGMLQRHPVIKEAQFTVAGTLRV